MTPIGFLSLVIALTAFSFRCFRRLAIAKGIVAHPNPLVRSHTDPVPYLGGLALFAVLLPMLLFWLASSATPGDRAVTMWICTACMLAIGLFDDIHPFGAVAKLVAQSAVCSIYLVAVAPPAPFHILSFGLRLGFILLIVNAFNLVDVMDGLLIVVASVATIGLLGGPFLSSPLNRIESWTLLATLIVGFWFNRPQARIYLGDAGALPLGFFIACLYLGGASNSAGPEALVHLGAFAVPLFEVALIVPARARRGLSPFRGSPDHFALRLQDQAGWSKGRVLTVTVAMGLFFDVWCFIPTDWILGPAAILGALSIGLGVAAYGLCWRLSPRQRDLACNASA